VREGEQNEQEIRRRRCVRRAVSYSGRSSQLRWAMQKIDGETRKERATSRRIDVRAEVLQELNSHWVAQHQGAPAHSAVRKRSRRAQALALRGIETVRRACTDSKHNSLGIQRNMTGVRGARLRSLP
jgi:hypothetical protein